MESPEKVQLDRIKSYNERNLILKEHVTYLLDLIEHKNLKIAKLQEEIEDFEDKFRHATGID